MDSFGLEVEADMIVAQSSAAGVFTVGGILFVVLMLLGAAFYFIPTIVAVSRAHPNTAPIVVINVLLGWTLVGYAVALAWAFLAIDRDRYPMRRRAGRHLGYGASNPFADTNEGQSSSENPFDFT